MQIVIEIPEKIYNDIQTKTEHGIIFNAVKNGTPLPKGHGRLIDADWLKFALHNFFYGLKRPVEEEDIQRYIDVARSIIEADTESEG